jgi:hypothetical protein
MFIEVGGEVTKGRGELTSKVAKVTSYVSGIISYDAEIKNMAEIMVEIRTWPRS